MLQHAYSRGIALIMTLLILVILSVLVGQLSYATKVDAYTAQNSTKDLQNLYALTSAMNYAIAYLQLDAMQEQNDDAKYDALSEIWNEERSIDLGETQVTYSIIDENSKFNLLNLVASKAEEIKENVDGDKVEQLTNNKNDDNDDDGDGSIKDNIKDAVKDKVGDKVDDAAEKIATSPEAQFDRLVSLMQGEKVIVRPRKLREDIVNWMNNKKGKEELEGGFANEVPLLSIKELLLAQSITSPILYGVTIKESQQQILGLMEYMTVLSDGKININTASKKVLQSLSKDIDSDLAENILQYREQMDSNGSKQVFREIEDIKKVSAKIEKIYDSIKELITVRSHFFTIEATAKSAQMVKKMRVVVYRSGKRVYKISCDHYGYYEQIDI